MSNSLDAIVALAADYPPSSTLVLSGTSIGVLFATANLMSQRSFWIDRTDPYDVITDAQWDELQEYIDRSFAELMTPMLGHIIAYATTIAPNNVLPCDGGTYLRTDFPELYAVIDSAFVVDADHFITPDLRGRTIVGAGSGAGLSARAVADTFGVEAHSLIEAENANHTHSDAGHNHIDSGHTHVDGNAVPTAILIGAGVPAPSAIPSVGVTGAGFAAIGTGFASLSSSGSGDAHENMQPSYALNYGLVCR